MKYVFILAVFLSPLTSGICQFSDSVNYYINFSGTGNVNKTNDGNTYLFNNVLRFSVRKNDLELNTTNSYIYGESKSSKSNSDFYSIAEVNYLKNKRKLYYWGLANYESSFSLKINSRFQGGLGVGYNLVNEPAFKLLLSDGLLYEFSRLSKPDKYDRSEYETIRNSFRIRFHLAVKDLITLDGSHFLQNSLEDKNDYIIKSNTILAFKLRKWLSLNTAVNYNRLNLTGTQNLLITYGLSAEKYF